ncbi:MAG TPA: HEAT repeat domain-containing protein [Polyangiaceae bacterium]|nr:HEAT repeat domain-containing protein [Polyangiaceae bacterium]
MSRIPAWFALVALCGACNHAPANPAQAKPAPSAAAAAAVVSWPTGSQGEYEVTLDSQLDFGRDRGTSALELRARLRYVVRDGGAGASTLLAELRDVSLKTGTPAELKVDTALGQEIQAPFVVSLVGGALGEMRVRPGASTFAVSILRSVSAGLQFAATLAQNERFVGHESDGTGSYEIEYTPLDASGRYARRKLRYQQLPSLQSKGGGATGLDQLALDFTPQVSQSKGELQVVSGRLNRVSYDELLTTKSPDGSDLRSRTQLALVTRGEPSATPPHEGSLAAEALVLKPGVAYANATENSNLDSARIGEYTFASALRVLEEAVKSPHQAKPSVASGAEDEAEPAPSADQREAGAFLALTALFRRDPANVDQAVRQIKAGSVAASRLQNALASSGAPAAERALLGLAAEPKVAAAVRKASVTNLSRAPMPSKAVVTQLSALIADPVLHVRIVYALGAIARKARAAGHAETARQLGDLLAAQLASATSEPDKITALHGIANAADASLLPRARPYLNDASGSLRQAAGLAVGAMQSPEADAALAERLATETKMSVRTALLTACRQRPSSPALIAAVQELALKSSEPHGRVEAVRVLAHWLQERPQLRETLALVANNDPVAKVRETAQRTLQ